MRGEQDDARLRRLFAELHRDSTPPPFARLWRPGTARPARRWLPAATTAGLALALVAGGLLWRSPPPGDERGAGAPEELALARSLSGWDGPLDFLLETPGLEFLTSLPELGAAGDPFANDPPQGEKEAS